MKIFFILASAFVVLFLASPTNTEAQQKKPLTNADVVAMVKAELSESTVIVAIQSSPANYDTTPQALIELKSQGISPKIIEAMLQAGAPATQAQPAQQPQTNNPLGNQLSFANGIVVIIDATGRTEMKTSPDITDMHIGVMNVVNPFGGFKTRKILKGEHARLRTPTASLTFEASVASNVYPTDQIGLVMLTQKPDRREIETGKVAGFGRDSSGFKKTDIVPIVIEEMKEQNLPGASFKRYTIRIASPLPSGEYAFVVSGIYYDFGVDPAK